VTVACQKLVQSILELPATDEIHMEDRNKVWPELSLELIRPMAYGVLPTMPNIPEISVGIQAVRFVPISSDRNIRDHLWRWSTYFG